MFSLENKYTHKKKKALNFDEPYKEKKKTATYSTADTWKAINEHILQGLASQIKFKFCKS